MAQQTLQLNGTHITWLGHATFKITSPQGKIILIDPWTYGNPACPKALQQVDKVDLMLATHGAQLKELFALSREAVGE